MSQALKTKLGKWADKLGHREALKRLFMSGLSPRIAQALVTGHYPNVLREKTVKKIILAMQEEGELQCEQKRK